MKITDFKRRIVQYYNSGLCIYVRGQVGVGKSTVVAGAPMALSEAKGGRYGMVLLNGPLLDPTDLLGYNVPGEHDGRFVSRFTEPFWFVTEDGKHLSECDGGIVFVDEEDKATNETKKILSELALSGRIGPHRLPKGWVVWLAGNRKGDRSGSTKDYDHSINRRMEIEIDFDLQSYESWLLEKGIHPLFVAVASQNAQLFTAALPDVQGPFCTPRSYARCAQYVASVQPNPDKVNIDPFLNEEMHGMIGPAAAAVVASGVTLYNEMPKFSEIIRAPKTAKVPERADAQILVVYNLAARVEEDTMGPVIEYVERLPAEFTIAFGKAAVARNHKLVNTKAFGDWCVRNETLMMALTSSS